MADFHTFAYVEDEPSQAILTKIIDYVNSQSPNRFVLQTGFPIITHGFGNLQKITQRFLSAAKKGGIRSIFLTDLDQKHSVQQIANEWFNIACLALLPDKLIFRIAVHEIESWIIADINGIANFLNVSPANFVTSPDDLDDPKQFLFNVIRSKCRSAKFKEMLPQKGQAVGIDYNPQIVSFIKEKWDIQTAMANSPSLKRAVDCFIQRLS